MIWGILAILALLVTSLWGLVFLSKKSGKTEDSAQQVKDMKSETDKMAEMAQAAVDRPSKKQVVDALRDNTFVILLVLALSACSTGTKYVCPPMPHYTKEFTAKAADQLEAMPDDSPVVILIEDSRAVRKACGY